MSTTTIESYEVIDEDLEISKPKKKGKEKPETQASSDSEAEEMAKLMQDMANKASELAFNSSLERAAKMSQELVGICEKKISALSEQYAKPRNMVLHVKVGDLPIKKLKHRACKVLPKLIAQSKIGQAGGNWPLLFGPTGCGKTVAAEQVAETLSLPFEHVNCSEGMSETWLWGRQTPVGFVPGGLWKCFKDGGVFLFDEADAANDNVWLSINTMLANGHAYNPISGETATRHKDFIAIAAANTNGKGGTGAHTGRTRLDGATLNRFAMFRVEYDRDLEVELCADSALLDAFWLIRGELEKKGGMDVVSTRDIKNGNLQVLAGFTHRDVFECLKLRMDKANHALFDDAIAKAGKKK